MHQKLDGSSASRQMSSLMPPVFTARTALSGGSFTLFSYVVMRVLNLLITVLLARSLSHEGMGILAGALLAIELVDAFRDFGVRDALIYHRGSDEIYTTAFVMVMGMSVIQCAGLLIFSRLHWGVASDVSEILPYLSLLFPLNALGTVPEALTQKRLQLFRRGLSDIINASCKLLVTSLMLALGYGIWSLVYGLLFAACARAIYLSSVARWQIRRPSFQEAIKLAKYSRHIALNDILGPILTRIDQLVIFNFLGAAALGPYYIAARIPEVAVTGVNMVMTRILFPSFVIVANDKDRLKAAYLTGLRYSSSVMLPISIGVALTADLSVPILFGVEWISAVRLLQILALIGIPLTLGWSVGDVLKANGHPHILMLLSLLDTIVAIVLVLCAIKFNGSIESVAFAMLMVECLSICMRLFVVKRHLPIRLSQILSTALPSILSCAGMAVCVIAFRGLWHASPIPELIGSVLMGCTSYCILLLGLDRSFREDLVKIRSGVVQ